MVWIYVKHGRNIVDIVLYQFECIIIKHLPKIMFTSEECLGTVPYCYMGKNMPK